MVQSIRLTQWSRALGIIKEQSIRQSSMVIVIKEQSIRHYQWARALSIINALAPSWWRQSQKVLFRASYYALPYDIFRALKSKCSEHRHYQMSMTMPPKASKSMPCQCPCRPKLQSQCHVRPWAKHEDNAIDLSS